MDDRELTYLALLRNRINLSEVPFTERGSRLLLFGNHNSFAIRLAERWVKLDGKLSSYRQRPPIIEDWRLLDENGATMPYEVTTYPHRLDVQAPVGNFTFVYQDFETILVSLPAARFGMSFRAHLDQAITDRRGGVLRLTGNIRRNIAYTINADILQNDVIPSGERKLNVVLQMDATAGDRAFLLNITPRLGFNRWIPSSQAVIEEAARRWQDWFAAAPQVLDEYQPTYYYAWWVMRAGLVSTRFYVTREVMMPSKVHYVGAWQWDNLFHALAYRHVDTQLAEDQVRILLDHQRKDGMIPDAIYDEGTVTHLDAPVKADVTKPPLIAWACWKLYEISKDREFLEEVYDGLVRWNRWWYERNDSDRDGLCEYKHPFSSGLDDSPLWDDGMPVESPDLNTYLILQQEALEKISQVLGEKRNGYLKRRRERLLRCMLETMWDEEAGLFWAQRLGRRIDVVTPFNLFPLLTAALPAEINERLVAHLTNPRRFWTRHPIPTVSLRDPRFDPWQMWRGPTWVNINYLFIEGLQRSGYTEYARELRKRTLNLVAGQPGIYEYYHPQTGVVPPRAAPMFGWTAALYIDLAIQASSDSDELAGGPR